MRRLRGNYISPTDYKFQDYQLSYESLEQMEKVDSANLTSLVLNNQQGYDFVSDMREDSVAPNEYEVGVGNSFYRLSKRLAAEEDENTPVENSIPEVNVSEYNEDVEQEEEIEEEIRIEDKIPNYLVLDVLKTATDDVVSSLTQRIKKAPVPVGVYIRYDNLNDADVYTNDSEVALTDYTDKVYTIYQMFLQTMNVYIIIQADRLTKDHKFYNWENVQYKGFFTTKQEAANYIKSAL